MKGFYRSFAEQAASDLATGFTRLTQGPRQDRGLPLGLQIGASILTQGPKLMLAAAEGHLVQAGNMHTAKVVSWGRMVHNGRDYIDRFYLDTGNPHDDLSLQIESGRDGRIYDNGMWLLTLIKEYGPNAQEWLRVLPAEGLLIKERRDQLAGLGWTEDQIVAQLADDFPNGVEPHLIGANIYELPDGKDPPEVVTQYWRHWPQGGAEYVDPVRLQEVYRDNPYGSQVMIVQQRAMLYSRVLPLPEGSARQPVDEWIWLQASEVMNPDGSPSNNVKVQIYAGIVLTESDFSVTQPA